LASLRARSLELDRLLADRRKEAEELRSHPLPSSFPLYAIAATLLFVAAMVAWVDIRIYRQQPDPQSVAPLHWNARVVSGNREGLGRGTECTVEVMAPCTAVVRCGSLGFHGQGKCSPCSFFSDGNPACHIDAKSGHAFLRGTLRHPNGATDNWWADLVQK
jgi:hypothetical protein